MGTQYHINPRTVDNLLRTVTCTCQHRQVKARLSMDLHKDNQATDITCSIRAAVIAATRVR